MMTDGFTHVLMFEAVSVCVLARRIATVCPSEPTFVHVWWCCLCVVDRWRLVAVSLPLPPPLTPILTTPCVSCLEQCLSACCTFMCAP